MLKLFSDNLKIISGLILCSPNDMGFFYFKPMVFSNKWVASEVTERISRNQLAVRCRNFCCPLKSIFYFYLVLNVRHKWCCMRANLNTQVTWLNVLVCNESNMCWHFGKVFSQDVWIYQHWTTCRSSWFCQLFSLEEKLRMWGGALPLLSHASKGKCFKFSHWYDISHHVVFLWYQGFFSSLHLAELKGNLWDLFNLLQIDGNPGVK